MKLFYTIDSLDVALPKRCSEYRFRYQSEIHYQPSYIVLLPKWSENAKMYADYSGEISRNCMSFDVYHSRELHFPFPSETTLKEIREVMNAVAPLMAKLAESYDTFIDRQGNVCGKWDQNLKETIYYYINKRLDPDFWY